MVVCARTSTAKICHIAPPCVAYAVLRAAIIPRHVSAMYVVCRIGWGVCWSGVAMPLRSKQSGDDALCNIRASTSKFCLVASPCVSYVVVRVAISPRHVSARPLPSKQSGDDALYVMWLVVFISARPLPSSRAATTQRMLCGWSYSSLRGRCLQSRAATTQRMLCVYNMHRNRIIGRSSAASSSSSSGGRSSYHQGRAEQSRAEHRHHHHHQGRAEQSIVIIIIHFIFRAGQSGVSSSPFIFHPSSISSFIIIHRIIRHPHRSSSMYNPSHQSSSISSFIIHLINIVGRPTRYQV